MIKKVKGVRLFVLLVVLSMLSGYGYTQGVETDMLEVSRIKEGVKTKRVSSSDRSGGNDDRIGNIRPGEKRVIFDVQGAGIINHIWFTISPSPESLSRNDIILRMYWDENEYPSVESPIGPFFGQGWNESYPYSSVALVASPKEGRGLVCYFSMPFARGARIEIENQNEQNIRSFYFYVDYTEMEELPDDYGRFHAWYNHELIQEQPQSKRSKETDKAINNGLGNYLIADIQGKGQFVGVNYYVHSPDPLWYGEGDDMVFIDGNEQRTLLGTGTEDYFNTAWCPQTIFQHPFFGYPRVNEEIGFMGRTHVYRFHITDPIYFDKSLKFTIEHGHGNDFSLDLGSVAYWYQQKASPLPPAPTKEERVLRENISSRDLIRLWRNGWKKNKGNSAQLWKKEAK